MEKSNSGMMGHGMPNGSTQEMKQVKVKKQKDATMFAKSKVDELFNLVKTEKGIVICCGKFKVSSKNFKTYKQADDYIATKPYEILINISVLMTKLNQNEEAYQSTKPQNSESK